MQSLVSSIISIKDIKDGFKKWRKNTKISPSSRHLEHYKSLLTFDDNKGKEIESFNMEILTMYKKIINAVITLDTPLNRWEIDSDHDWKNTRQHKNKQTSSH